MSTTGLWTSCVATSVCWTSVPIVKLPPAHHDGRFLDWSSSRLCLWWDRYVKARRPRNKTGTPILSPLKTVKAVGWHQELLQGRQIRRHDVRQALTSEFGVSSPSRGGRCKGVSLPFVLFAKLGRRRQFVVPLNVRIKLAIRLAVTTAALSKRRSPCRVMAMPIVSQCGPARVHFHDSWCRQDMGN